MQPVYVTGLSTEVLHGFLCERKARQQAGSAA